MAIGSQPPLGWLELRNWPDVLRYRENPDGTTSIEVVFERQRPYPINEDRLTAARLLEQAGVPVFVFFKDKMLTLDEWQASNVQSLTPQTLYNYRSVLRKWEEQLVRLLETDSADGAQIAQLQLKIDVRKKLLTRYEDPVKVAQVEREKKLHDLALQAIRLKQHDGQPLTPFEQELLEADLVLAQFTKEVDNAK